MKKYLLNSLFLIILVAFLNCEKKKEPGLLFLPVNPDAKLKFISYVTNEKNEIIHQFEYFERQYIYTDTVGSRLIHHYLDHNKLAAFYQDDSGTIWNQTNIDLAALAVGFGFKYQDSVAFSYWKPVIKMHKGIGTSWNLKADTTFRLVDSEGKEHLLQYDFSGNAKYQGWKEIIVPENRNKKMTVRQVQWDQFKYFIYDQTSGDSLLVQEGTASDYFDPELGLIRATVDYTQKVKDKPKVFQKSTFELSSKLIPEQV